MQNPKEYIKQKIEYTEKEVASLEIKLSEYTHKLDVAHRALQGLRDFFQFEFQTDTTKEVSDKMDNKDTQRFVDMTIREACRLVLKENGPLHARYIQRLLIQGGRPVMKTSVTSILIRGKEFERVPGKENTFKIKEDIEKGQPI